MAQVTIYLNDETEARARRAAQSENTSLGRWIADLVSTRVKDSWPPEVLAAIGRFPDFPDSAIDRNGYGPDSHRDPLD